ncbi:MAG: ATP-grasp domain-containing protein [Pseudomonadota bacterium]
MTAQNTALLTLGRLPKALDIARALHGAGWRVIVAEPCRWHLCAVSTAVARSIRVPSPTEDSAAYREAMLGIIAAESVDFLVPVSEECLHVAALGDALPDSVRVLSMPLAEVAALHDKYSFAQYARDLGLSAPTTLKLDEPGVGDLVAAGSIVIKGRNSCSGVGLELVDRGATLPHRLYPGEWVAQAHVDGDLVSTFSVAHNGQTLVTAVYRGTLFSDTVAVCFERLSAEVAVERWVEAFVAANNYTGFIAFDFVIDSDGTPWAIECNPRSTSGIHFLRSEALGQLLLNPGKPVDQPFRREREFMQFWPALTEVQSSMFHNGFADKLAAFRRARDVCFRWRDPLPLWTMPITAWRILRLALFGGRSFGEAATFDIEWRPQARTP